MLAEDLLPPKSGLVLDALIWQRDELCLEAHTTALSAACPLCGQTASRVHSCYRRSLQDLPCAGHRVKLTLVCRKFFCDNGQCMRRIFAEPLPGVALRHAQSTERLGALLQALALLLGSRPAQRVARLLPLQTSHDSLLRQARRWRWSPSPTPRVLGVDDWAFRRGAHYGTILVDLERRQVIDLLPDREKSTLRSWLQNHPGIEVISRDRGGAYAEAASAACPHVVQVADRWHLLKNLGEALERWLHHHSLWL